MKKVVITGGTYAGKTSLINVLKKEGFITVPDIGFAVIQELNSSLGIKKQQEFRVKKPAEFYTKIIRKQLRLEKEQKATTVFYDQGVFDYIAMMRVQKKDMPPALIELVKDVTYDTAIVCEILKGFSTRPETGRSLGLEQSKRLGALAKKMYHSNGSKIVELKEMPIQKRVNSILKEV